MFSPNTHTSHFLPGIIRENQQNQTLFSIKTISMVNCPSKNKSVLFFSQREFNPNTYTNIKNMNISYKNHLTWTSIISKCKICCTNHIYSHIKKRIIISSNNPINQFYLYWKEIMFIKLNETLFMSILIKREYKKRSMKWKRK